MTSEAARLRDLYEKAPAGSPLRAHVAARLTALGVEVVPDAAPESAAFEPTAEDWEIARSACDELRAERESRMPKARPPRTDDGEADQGEGQHCAVCGRALTEGAWQAEIDCGRAQLVCVGRLWRQCYTRAGL